MEILRHSLEQDDLKKFTAFQLSVYKRITPLLERILVNKLSKNSIIEMGGLGVDIFLELGERDFALYFSIQENSLVVNSKYFDIYVYDDTDSLKIDHLLEQLLLGKYSIILEIGNKEKLVHKKFIFNDEKLSEFNENHRIGFFRKKTVYEKKIDGFQLIEE